MWRKKLRTVGDNNKQKWLRYWFEQTNCKGTSFKYLENCVYGMSNRWYLGSVTNACSLCKNISYQ